MDDPDLGKIAEGMRRAAAAMAVAPAWQRNRMLLRAAEETRSGAAAILEANRRDQERARAAGLSAVMIDRLSLDGNGIEAIAAGLETVACLPDPVGEVLESWYLRNGVRVERVSTPIGIIGVIFESRPNVLPEAASLCLKAGNAAFLRGGSESLDTCRALHLPLERGLGAAGLPPEALFVPETGSRHVVDYMLQNRDFLDLVVPRGGKSLTSRVREIARVPVLAHLDGNCHVYVHAAADPEKAVNILTDSKAGRPSACNAAESLLVDRGLSGTLLPQLLDLLHRLGCEVRADAETVAIDPRCRHATEQDWGEEYLGHIISVRQVSGPEEAVAHIARHGSGHTDAIITEDSGVADFFLARTDSAVVIHNASTRFADGGQFGMGAEIGIATGRLHARGPVGARQLTCFKYRLRGSGQTRSPA